MKWKTNTSTLWSLKLLNIWIIISKWCAISTSIRFSLNNKCLAGEEIEISEVVNPRPEVVVYLKPAASKTPEQDQRTKFCMTMLQTRQSNTFWEIAAPRTASLERCNSLNTTHKCLWRHFSSDRELRVLIPMDVEDRLTILKTLLWPLWFLEYLILQMRPLFELSLPWKLTKKCRTVSSFYVF